MFHLSVSVDATRARLLVVSRFSMLFPGWSGNIPPYCAFLTDLDLSHEGDDDDDEAYDYKFVKWMIKEKVIHVAVWL